MLKILTPSDAGRYAGLFDEMFRARAAIFHDRLGWNVCLRNGLEIDSYDTDACPIYIVSLNRAGALMGSLRLLPTTGATMLSNEFSTYFDEPPHIHSPRVWECTRFCVHTLGGLADRTSQRRVSSELLIGLCELALANGIDHVVGLYETCMTRVYHRIGWSPRPLAFSRPEVGRLVVGTWEVSHLAIETMHARRRDHSTGAVERAA